MRLNSRKGPRQLRRRQTGSPQIDQIGPLNRLYYPVDPSGWFVQQTMVAKNLRAVDAVNANVAYAVGEGGAAIRTTDGGKKWQTMNFGPLEHLALHFDDVNVGWGCFAHDSGTGDAQLGAQLSFFQSSLMPAACASQAFG